MHRDEGGSLVVAPIAAGRLPTFQRAAELVDISERIYRQVFAVGLWVAACLSAFAAATSLLQPTTASQLRGLAACAICVAACAVAARRAGPVYRALRRRPWLLVIPGAVLGVAAALVGKDNFQLFVPIIAVLGVMGLATPQGAVTAAGLIAALGLAAPQVMEGHANLSGAIAVLVPPLLFWLIVDRIAGFALRLHQSLDAGAASPPAAPGVAGDEGREAGTDAAGDRIRPELAAPRRMEVDGVRLTSRQLQVIMLASEGLQHGEIGMCLDIGPAMVRRHLDHAKQRAGCATTPELVAWARRAGLVPGG